MSTIKFETKQQALAAWWLQKASQDSSHKSLHCIHTNNQTETSIATDGFRIHRTHHKQADLPNGTHQINDNKPLYKSPDRSYTCEHTKGMYPKTSQVYPQGEPKVRFAINKEYLQEALDMPTTGPKVHIDVWIVSLLGKQTGVVQVTDPDGHFDALIYGMRDDRNKQEGNQ